jgi:hypothetical protein
MHAIRGTIAAACLLTCAAGCSSAPAAAPSTPPPSRPSTTVPATTSATSTFVPAVSPDKLSAACPLLDGNELGKTANDFLKAMEFTSTEGAPKQQGKVVDYTCVYKHSADEAELGELTVTALSGPVTPQAALKATEKGCAGKATPLDGAGDAAMSCTTPENDTLVITLKRSHGEVRMAAVSVVSQLDDTVREYKGQVIDPQIKVDGAALAKLVGSRL